MKARAPIVLSVIAACACAVAVIALFGGWNAAEKLKDGSVIGFDATGMYVVPDANPYVHGYRSLALLESGENEDEGKGVFQLQASDQSEAIDGTFVRASDPNLLILTDGSGEHVGVARIAYSVSPEEGVLILTVDDESWVIPKKAARPAFIQAA